MTVSSTTNRVAYVGNGTANPLAVAFPFFATTDLVVVETVIATGVSTTKAITTDYTVTGTPDANGYYTAGGSVVPVAVIAATKTWTIYRDPAVTQLVVHVDNDPLPAASIDNPLDKLTQIAQRLKEGVTRSIRAPEGDAVGTDLTLPSSISRASKFLAFDSSGNPALTDLSGVATIVAATTLEVFLSKSVSLAAADSAAVILGAIVVIDADYTLIAHTVLAAKGYRFAGGKITLGNFNLTFNYQIQAHATKIFTATGSGVVVMYGAVAVLPEWWGTNGTTDYAAMAAAVACARGAGQGIVLLSFATYTLETLPLNISGVSVIGPSDIGCIIKRGNTATGAQMILLDGSTAGGAARMRYQGFQIDGNSSGNANANVCLCLVGNVINNDFNTIQIMNSKTGGMKLSLGAAARPNVCSFTNLQIIAGSGYGIEIAAGTTLHFKTLDIEIMAGIALNITGADEAPGRLTFEDFDIERSGDGAIDAVVVAGNADRVAFIRGNIQDYGNSAGTAGNGINVSAGRRVTIDGVDIAARAGASVATHRKIVIGVGSSTCDIKNHSFTFGTDIEDNSTSSVYSNDSIGFQGIPMSNAAAFFGEAVSVAAGQTRYIGGASVVSATETNVRTLFSGRGNFGDMWAESTGLPGGTDTYTITLMKNGVATGLTGALSNAGGGIIHITASVAMAPGDYYSIKVVNSATGATVNAGNLHITLGIRK